MPPVDMGATPFGRPLVQVDRLDPQVTRDLCMRRLRPWGRDVWDAMAGLEVDPADVGGPCVTPPHR